MFCDTWRKADKETLVNSAEEVQQFERLEQQLHSMLEEMSELSKKRPNDGVNKFKLKLVNVLLEGMNEFLGAHRPFKDFQVFDENDLPTNSDVLVMLSQYAAAVLQFRMQNTEKLDYKWWWRLSDGSVVETGSPDEFKFGAK